MASRELVGKVIINSKRHQMVSISSPDLFSIAFAVIFARVLYVVGVVPSSTLGSHSRKSGTVQFYCIAIPRTRGLANGGIIDSFGLRRFALTSFVYLSGFRRGLPHFTSPVTREARAEVL